MRQYYPNEQKAVNRFTKADANRRQLEQGFRRQGGYGRTVFKKGSKRFYNPAELGRTALNRQQRDYNDAMYEYTMKGGDLPSNKFREQHKADMGRLQTAGNEYVKSIKPAKTAMARAGANKSPSNLKDKWSYYLDKGKANVERNITKRSEYNKIWENYGRKSVDRQANYYNYAQNPDRMKRPTTVKEPSVKKPIFSRAEQRGREAETKLYTKRIQNYIKGGKL